MALQFRQGRLTVGQPPVAGATPPYAPVPQPEEPFVWSESGQRISPVDLALQRKAALSRTQPDFSPVQHWTQGVGRAASQILGALELRQLDRRAAAQQAENSKVIAALIGPGNQDLAAGLASADPGISKVAAALLESRQPKQMTPYRINDNAGNVWQQMPDGSFQLIFVDKAPKQVVANGQLITSTNPYIDGGQPNPARSPATMPQPGSIVDDPRLQNAGGPTQPASGTFQP